MVNKPFSQACENNKHAILEVLAEHLKAPGTLLEIGSGTGQHAAWLPRHLPHTSWQPSDRRENLPGIRAWLDQDPPANVLPPIELDVRDRWPYVRYGALFTANTFHIMSRETVVACIRGAATCLMSDGLFMVYGPFNRGGAYSSDSNARFDAWLRERDPASGIRDIEWLQGEMAHEGLQLVHEHAMPANNRMLVWQAR